MNDKCLVLVDDWQMQCCGIPFNIGDMVNWIVCKYEKNSYVTNKKIEYCYEHHSSELEKLFKLTGIVENIKAVFCSLEPHPDQEKYPGYNHKVYRKAIEVTSADGWDKNIDDLQLGWYEVELKNIAVRAAKKKEITFS